MTMLDRMRRHKGWLKWSLALVVLAFIIFYIPAFLGRGDSGQGGAPSDTVASVDGRDISVAEFQRTYQAQIQMYRSAYGGNVSEQMLKQLGIDQQILQQMVEEQASLAEAKRQGIDVSDAELAQRILLIPAFQENGQFIGQARYAALLRMQRPPMSVDEFEQNLRKSLVVEKLRAALTEWVSVGDKDVEQEYRRRNEKVKLEMVSFPADKYRSGVTVTDAELAPYFEAHKEQYRIGEKRKIRYLLVDVDSLRTSSQPTTREVQRAYNDNAELYSTPEQVRASHILLKTAGKKEDEVKARAEQVLKEAKAGGDFAALAKKYSEDEASAKQGGDLDFFSRGKMVPEFDEVAFKLQPGEISDLVKTQYGFHIIEVTDKKAASIRTIDEVRPQLVDQLATERAGAKAADMAGAMEKEISKPADLDKVAAARGLKVQESGFFTREEPILGLGPSPQAVAEAFTLKSGEVSGSTRVPSGYAFLTVTGTQAPHLPSPDEVKDRVKEDLTRQKAKELALQKATAMASALKSGGDLAKAAKAAGLEVKTTDLIPRESPLPEIGVSQQVDAAAFTLPAGAVSDPIVADNAVAVVKVVEHKQPTPAEFAADRDRLREEMLNDRRGRFFAAYIQKAKQKMKIEVNRENLQRVIG
ncbi:MAG TPA: SurA N-terminal domain-containing protein [Vicinamibacterales bacterium]